MSKEEIFNVIKEIFKKEFDFYKDEVKLNTNLEKQLPKIDQKEFLLLVEEYFELRIPSRLLPNIKYVEDLVNCLHRLI